MNHQSLLFRLIRLAITGLTFRIDGEGGGAVEPSPAPAASVDPTPAPAPASDTSAPASMLDAITQGLNQPRDEFGRFANKPADAPADPTAAAPAAPATPTAAQPAQPAQQQPGAKQQAKPGEDDLTTMPEGLQPKAQERFQRLANTVREQEQQLQQAQQAIGYVQQTFQENGVKREQFEQATAFIGAVNRGDFATAEHVLLGQLQQLSLLTGKNYGAAVDPLANHGDLRQAVDQLQITEQHAIELARGRQTQQAMQQRHQQQAQQQQETQRQQHAVQQGTQAVDALCKQLAATDMDYPAIEAQLLPVLPKLLQGMPPNQWENAVRVQYDLLKSAASTFRQNQAGSVQSAPLRPTGSAQVHQAPRTMHEAMWGPR